MITDDKIVIGIVIECFDHGSIYRVLEVQSEDSPKMYHFFYILRHPEVNFGDTVQMNFPKAEFYVYRGNSRLTFKINPHIFPNTLLWELISERLSEDLK